MNDLSITPSQNLVKDTTTQDFVKDVIEESQNQPVLVDFWAPWCGPCRQLTPTIEKAVNDSKGKVKLVKLNIDEYPEIPGQMGVQSIPAVFAFSNGKPIDGFMGAQPESAIKQLIEKISGPSGPSAEETYLEKAEELLTENQLEEAAGLFNAVLQTDQKNLRAIVGLAKVAIGLGHLQQAEKIMDMIPQEEREDTRVKALVSQITLLEKAADTGDIQPLLLKIEQNPDDHQARFDLALAMNAQGKRTEAANCLLEIFQRDRNWNDDGARKELLTFFEAWGVKDPATIAARRKLSSLMFS